MTQINSISNFEKILRESLGDAEVRRIFEEYLDRVDKAAAGDQGTLKDKWDFALDRISQKLKAMAKLI